MSQVATPKEPVTMPDPTKPGAQSLDELAGLDEVKVELVAHRSALEALAERLEFHRAATAADLETWLGRFDVVTESPEVVA